MEKNRTPESIETRFAHFGARIDDLLGTVEHDEFVSGLKSELAVWHEWIDEARVQLALGTMESRDRVAEALNAIERVYSRMMKRAEDLEDLDQPLPGLSEAVKQELGAAKEELASPDVFAS
jgi:hypothetical protein